MVRLRSMRICFCSPVSCLETIPVELQISHMLLHSGKAACRSLNECRGRTLSVFSAPALIWSECLALCSIFVANYFSIASSTQLFSSWGFKQLFTQIRMVLWTIWWTRCRKSPRPASSDLLTCTFQLSCMSHISPVWVQQFAIALLGKSFWLC